MACPNSWMIEPVVQRSARVMVCLPPTMPRLDAQLVPVLYVIST